MKSRSKVPFDLVTDPPARRDTLVALSVRVGMTREVLTTLTEATRAGQRHLMCRVLDILQADLVRPTVRFTQPQAVAVMAAVTELQHEAALGTPDIALFCARARLVIDILSIT
jgi:IMP dehydrogenase/GMP reductase